MKFNEDKGYGFIRDENGNNRFFHISDVITTVPITLFSEVIFEVGSNEKGDIAKKIKLKIKELKTKPTFIVFGNERIKLTNIKSYGMDVNTYTKDIPIEMTGFEGALSIFGLIIGKNLTAAPKYKKEITKKNVLYVTTYQKDNYRFEDTKVNFNIYNKLKELDEYLS